tara:strand:+ start:330 stop:449 length:120 start_codon:yes stop_codon:yes gene_type:complete
MDRVWRLPDKTGNAPLLPMAWVYRIFFLKNAQNQKRAKS